MEIYKTTLTDNRLIDNNEFTISVIQFLLSSFGKTNIIYPTFSGFELALNHGIKVFGTYKIEYIHSHSLMIQFKYTKDKENNITTIVIPISITLTNTLKEEIEYFVEEYLKENNK